MKAPGSPCANEKFRIHCEIGELYHTDASSMLFGLEKGAFKRFMEKVFQIEPARTSPIPRLRTPRISGEYCLAIEMVRAPARLTRKGPYPIRFDCFNNNNR